MGINESTIRRIIREEARRVLREGDEQSALKISEVSWDAEHGPDGGNVLIAFEWEGQHPVSIPDLKVYIASEPSGYSESKKIDALIEEITTEINTQIDDEVTEDQVYNAIEAAAKQDPKNNQSTRTMLSNMETTFNQEY
jgi:hypothetical protein